jgi:hypothetical protein
MKLFRTGGGVPLGAGGGVEGAESFPSADSRTENRDSIFFSIARSRSPSPSSEASFRLPFAVSPAVFPGAGGAGGGFPFPPSGAESSSRRKKGRRNIGGEVSTPGQCRVRRHTATIPRIFHFPPSWKTFGGFLGGGSSFSTTSSPRGWWWWKKWNGSASLVVEALGNQEEE